MPGADAATVGVYRAGRKLGSVGIRVQHGITTHGVGLNRDPDLEWFALMTACGAPGVPASSIAAEGGDPDRTRVEQALAAALADRLRLARDRAHPRGALRSGGHRRPPGDRDHHRLVSTQLPGRERRRDQRIAVIGHSHIGQPALQLRPRDLERLRIRVGRQQRVGDELRIGREHPQNTFTPAASPTITIRIPYPR